MNNLCVSETPPSAMVRPRKAQEATVDFHLLEILQRHHPVARLPEIRLRFQVEVKNNDTSISALSPLQHLWLLSKVYQSHNSQFAYSMENLHHFLWNFRGARCNGDMISSRTLSLTAFRTQKSTVSRRPLDLTSSPSPQKQTPFL